MRLAAAPGRPRGGGGRLPLVLLLLALAAAPRLAGAVTDAADGTSSSLLPASSPPSPALFAASLLVVSMERFGRRRCSIALAGQFGASLCMRVVGAVGCVRSLRCCGFVGGSGEALHGRRLGAEQSRGSDRFRELSSLNSRAWR